MDGMQDDTGDGSMLCTEHPFKNNTPAGGICAFCLQEKLGKLVSSSFPIAVFPSSSSSSPSFRSDIGNTNTTISSSSSAVVPPPRLTNSSSTNTIINPNNCHYHDSIHQHHSHSNGSRILYLLGQKKKKKKDLGDGVHPADRNNNLVFKRSKSTASVPRRGSGLQSLHYMDGDIADGMTTTTTTPHKRGFWSFLYLQKHSSSVQRKTFRDISSNSMRASVTSSFANVHRSQPASNIIVVEENGSPCHASFDRKVSRSRSVGCGSRSFSGDFFERISTGFGDCTLRRVESQSEGKVKPSTIRTNGQDCIQERARCGGLFSGFMITSSSSSSSSSSNWVGSNTNEGNATGKVTSAVAGTGQHSRSKSWGWALASPMRAFSKPASSKKKNPTPNLNAVPSLLSVGS